jgi:hypothetical protein
MASTVDDLLADPPLVHGPEGSNELLTHGLLENALRWLGSTVQPGDRTLETGSGLSTCVFAMRGARHTCIVPQQQEVDRLLEWCRAQGVATDDLDFRVDVSERVLPTLDTGPLDLVLIDGSHSFPQVFIDWFFVAERLKVGGYLIVDDVHVWTGRVLRGFLAAEPEWELEQEWSGRTVRFRKTAEVDPNRLWTDQPYVWKRTRPGVVGRARMATAMIRSGEYREVVGRVGAIVRAKRGS